MFNVEEVKNHEIEHKGTTFFGYVQKKVYLCSLYE